MAMTSSQVKVKQDPNNMAGTGTGWPRRNSINFNATAAANFDSKYPSAALNRIINL